MRVVLRVTGRALRRRSLELPAHMAALTGNAGMLAVQMEDRVVVVEGGRSPAVWRVAGLALIAQRTGMRIVIGMAGGAVLRRAFEFSANVTVLTGNCVVFTNKREGELGMIHLSQLPSVRGVAQGAVRSKLTVVVIVFLMTGEARLRSRL